MTLVVLSTTATAFGGGGTAIYHRPFYNARSSSSYSWPVAPTHSFTWSIDNDDVRYVNMFMEGGLFEHGTMKIDVAKDIYVANSGPIGFYAKLGVYCHMDTEGIIAGAYVRITTKLQSTDEIPITYWSKQVFDRTAFGGTQNGYQGVVYLRAPIFDMDPNDWWDLTFPGTYSFIVHIEGFTFGGGYELLCKTPAQLTTPARIYIYEIGYSYSGDTPPIE